VSALRKGWCPSVLRPMASGDGLIVRVSIKDGRVSPALARALATLSRRFGNGLLDLSARANLQLRGASDASLLPLQQELRALGVVETDSEPTATRNILVSPLADIDPQAIIDIRPCVRALRERLAHEPIVHQLPQKFGFVVDDGGTLSLADEKTDVSFLARRSSGEPRFLICLAGQIAGECAIDEVADVGLRIAHAFLQLSDERWCGVSARRKSLSEPALSKLRGQLKITYHTQSAPIVSARIILSASAFRSDGWMQRR
jgi:precorrin-3B synthase